LHDGVGGPACVVVSVLSDAIQEGQFSVLDDVGKARESVPTSSVARHYHPQTLYIS